ncbi:hypothetical protein [Sporosarcina jiandibaonis]|uniref:hypothetical protein n=1 Tax=Sporosarcina jiandibaonis TaxID=2715535 RepID=UPI0015547685|nr:hypothetical protein [Sporosarcina jiandibaonis]
MNPKKRYLRNRRIVENYCDCNEKNPSDPQPMPPPTPDNQQDCFCPNFALGCGDTFDLWHNRWLEAKRQGLDLFVIHQRVSTNQFIEYRIEEFVRSACMISVRTNSFQVGEVWNLVDFATDIVSYEYKLDF